MTRERHRLAYLWRNAAFYTPLRAWMGPRYSYRHSPAQLAFLCRCIDDTRDVPGSIVEAGCYVGHTTLFLNRHMTCEGIEKPYVAVDTFAGFTRADLDVEAGRGKDRGYYRGEFAVNDRRWFDSAVRRAGVTRVRSVAQDVGRFDFSQVAPIALCLLDVCFYQPTSGALPRIWGALAPGGIVVVDDCWEEGPWDGAGQAYRKFVQSIGAQARVEHHKYGILAKQRSDPSA